MPFPNPYIGPYNSNSKSKKNWPIIMLSALGILLVAIVGIIVVFVVLPMLSVQRLAARTIK